MSVETFVQKFAVISNAPIAIKKIRELVLNLSMRGKLVPQDPNESLSDSIDEIIPATSHLDVPKSWRWTEFGKIAEISGGFAFKSGDYSPSGIFILRVTNIASSGEINKDDPVFLPSEKITKEVERFLLNEGDILLVMVGGSLGKIGLVTSDILPALLNQNLWRITPADVEVESRFLRLLTDFAVSFRRQITHSTHGHLSREEFRKKSVALPPLAEQKRIVAKVDELMALCDRLEAQLQDRDTQQVSLSKAALARFADDPTPANLEYLFHPSFDISPADLRKTILTLAVQGKLVPQDEEAKSPQSASCEPDDALVTQAFFEIPIGWRWTRLTNLAEINGGFAFKSTDYTNNGTRVVRISDFDEFGFKDHKIVRHPFTSELEKFRLVTSNILMAMTGGTVGKSYFVRDLPEPMIVNQRVATIKVSDSASPSFIDIVIRSEMTQEVIRRAKNSTNDNISMSDIKGFAIPLPPFPEQKRIVAKVDELMALVDQLEAQLAECQSTGEKLMEALVAELTAKE